MTDSSPSARFKATVMLAGKTATGIEVPEEAVEALGAGKKPAVEVRINGGAYRTTVAPRGGKFLIPVSAENRAIVGVEAGDEVEVEIVLDSKPRTVELPPDLEAALAGELKAREYFDGLAPSHKKEYVRWVEEAKREETRRNRVEKSVAALLEGRKQH